MRRIAKDEGIDKILKQYDVDVVIGPSDGGLQSWRHVVVGSFSLSQVIGKHAEGYPLAQMTLGYVDYNGRPYRPSVVAQAGREDLLVEVMGA